MSVSASHPGQIPTLPFGDAYQHSLYEFLDAQLDAAYFLLPLSCVHTGNSPDFVIEAANSKAAHLSATPVSALKGRRLTELPHCPQDNRGFIDSCRHVKETHQPVEDEFPLVLGERSLWFRYRITPLLGGLCVSVRDITPDKNMHLSLLDLSLQHEQMLEGILDGFLIIDQNLRVLYTNTMGEVVLQCRRHDAIGNPITHLLPETLGSAFVQEAERVRNTGSQVSFDVVHEPLNLEFTITLRCSFNGLCAVFKDVTLIKQQQRNLNDLLKRYENLTKNIPGAIYQFALEPDNTMTFLNCSPGIKDLTGLDAHTFCKRFPELLQALEPLERKAFEESVLISARDLSIWNWEGPATPVLGGVKRWLRATSKPSLRADGVVVWDGILIDLTLPKEAQGLFAQGASP